MVSDHFLVLFVPSIVRFCARLAMVESRSPLNRPVLAKLEPAVKEDLLAPKALALELEPLLDEFMGCKRSPKPSSPPKIIKLGRVKSRVSG